MSHAKHHAIITGGSSGIGKAIAKLLASQGADISIIARDRTKLDSAKKEIETASINPEQIILTITADVANREQATQAIKTAIAQIGPPSILITSAGIAHPGYFEELPLEIFEQTIAVNYFGSLYCLKAALPSMKQQKKGHIVLISSGAGLIGIYGYTPYSPSKFAIRGLAESLRLEMRQFGIDISVVYPPDTDTPQLEEENKIKPLETKKIAATAKTWSPENVAIEIVKGMQKKKFAIAPGLEMSILAKLHSLILPQIHWFFERIISKLKPHKESDK